MSDCERIEAAIGRELSLDEMCACGIALLSGHAEAQIVRDLKARDGVIHIRHPERKIAVTINDGGVS